MEGSETQEAVHEGGAGKREAILAAAARMIASSGVRGLRVERVAAEAGVSPPLLYYHFQSRAGLVRAALERASARAPSAALRDAEGESYGAIESALLAEFDDEQDIRDNAVVWGEAAASAVFEDNLRPDLRRVAEDWVATVRSAIEAGQADGSISAGTNAGEAAEILVSVVDGLCSRWLAGVIERDHARKVVRAAVDATLR